MRKSGLYLITDERLTSSETLPDQVKHLLPYISILQFRAKSLPRDIQYPLASQLAELCTRAGVIFLVNDDIDLAKSSGAHGVHLGQTDRSPRSARSLLGTDAIIGVTCHDSLHLAQAAVAQTADYVAFGRFFPSKTKAHAPPAQMTTLTQAKRQLQVPIVAIGGITSDNGSQLLAAGADLLAVIHDVWGADEPLIAAQRYQRLFQQG